MYFLVALVAKENHVSLSRSEFWETSPRQNVVQFHFLDVEWPTALRTQPFLLLVSVALNISHVVCQLLRTLMVARSRAFLHSAIREGDVKASIQQSERTLPPSFLLLLLIRCDDHRPARLVNHYVAHSSFLSFISHSHLSHPFNIHVVNVLRFT